MPKSKHGEIAYQFVKEHPDMTPTQMAKELRKKHPQYFKSEENARALVRVYMGRNGERARDVVQTKDTFRPIGKYNLPPEECNEWKPVKLLRNENNVGFIADLHFPEHDNRAIGTALDYLTGKGMNTLILGGDIIDNASTSYFPHPPNVKGVQYEIDCMKSFLDGLRHQLPNISIYYLWGNHEERMNTYIWSKAKELDDLEDLKLENLMGLVNYNIKPVLYRNRIEAGDLDIYHGSEFGKGGSGTVNLSRRMFLKTNHNSLFAHFHQSDSFIKTNSRGKATGCWSVGALCNLHPFYARNNSWNQGCARIDVFKDESFSVENKIIMTNTNGGDRIDYKIY